MRRGDRGTSAKSERNRQRTDGQTDRLTSLVLAMVSAMMLAAPGSSVTGMKGRDEAPEAEGVRADDGVTASSEEGTCSHTHKEVQRL